jgi:hypothetical protein
MNAYTDPALLLGQACNPLRSAEDRRLSYDAWEREQWFDAVYHGRLHVRDLERKWQKPVEHLMRLRVGA